MASEEVLDLEGVLQPVSEDQPAGSDPRLDSSPASLYFTIKQARNSARAAERNSLFDEEAASELLDKWRPVLEIAPRILREQAKDLEITTWYVEALIRFYGFAGLRDGFQLLRALVERYWDGLFPEPDEDGLETKVAPLTGLNGEGGEGTLLAPIRNTEITDQGSSGAFSFWQYQQASDIEKLADPAQKEQRSATLGFDLKTIRKQVAETSTSFYVDLRDDLEQALEHYRELNRLLDDHCGHDAPPSSNIRNLLEDVLGVVKHLAKDKLAAADKQEAAKAEAAAQPEEQEEMTTASPTPQTSVSAVAFTGAAVQSREDALRSLAQIAEFFRKTEPHSPLANAIDRAVRWGRMPLHELLFELLPDKSARATYAQLTGVQIGAGGEFVPPPPVAASPQAGPEEEEEDAPGW